MIDFRQLPEVVTSLVVLAIILLVNHFVFDDQTRFPDFLIVGGFAATGCIYFVGGLLQRRRARAADGWHYLTPAPLEWFGFVLGAALTLLFLWVYYFVGTARPLDPISQMQALKWLILFFSAGTVISGFFSFGISTRWNDELIERHVPFLPPTTILLRNVSWIYREIWFDCLVFGDAAGNRIRFSPHKNGAEALVLKLFGIKEDEEPEEDEEEPAPSS